MTPLFCQGLGPQMSAPRHENPPSPLLAPSPTPTHPFPQAVVGTPGEALLRTRGEAGGGG